MSLLFQVVDCALIAGVGEEDFDWHIGSTSQRVIFSICEDKYHLGFAGHEGCSCFPLRKNICLVVSIDSCRVSTCYVLLKLFFNYGKLWERQLRYFKKLCKYLLRKRFQHAIPSIPTAQHHLKWIENCRTSRGSVFTGSQL
jgi:hypothetical protein